MELPIALFVTFLGLTIFLTIIGIARRVPALIVASGIFIVFWSITTDSIIVDYDTNNLVPTESLIREQIIQTNTLQLYNGSFNSTAQVFLANNPLIGREINTIQLILFRTGSPTGDAQVGIMDSTAGNFKQIFNTIDSSTVSTSITQYNFTLPIGQSYTVEENDRVGIHFNSGDNLNRLNTRYFNADILGNENFQFSSTSTWSDFPSGELTYKIFGFTESIETTPIVFPFTELPKVAFGLFGGIMILAGAIIAMREF